MEGYNNGQLQHFSDQRVVEASQMEGYNNLIYTKNRILIINRFVAFSTSNKIEAHDC